MDWLLFVGPPLLWVQAVYASPFLKTYRHSWSAMMSILAGALLLLSARLDEAAFPFAFWAGASTVGAMIITLLWAPSRRSKRSDR